MNWSREALTVLAAQIFTMKINQSKNYVEGKDLEAGTYAAVIVDLLDCGRPRNAYMGEDKGVTQQVWPVFMLDEENGFGDRWEVRHRYPLNMTWGKKSKWLPFLQGVLGADNVSKILEGGEFNQEMLIGRQVLVTIELNERGEGENRRAWPNVVNVTTPPKGMPPVDPKNYVRQQNRASYEGPVPSAFDDVMEDVISTKPVFIGATGNAYSPFGEYADQYPRLWQKDIPTGQCPRWEQPTHQPGFREGVPASSAADVLLGQEAHHITPPHEPIRQGGRIAVGSEHDPKQYAKDLAAGREPVGLKVPERVTTTGEVDPDDPFEGE